MAKGRQRHEWAMAAAIQATQANTMRGKNRPPFRGTDFMPRGLLPPAPKMKASEWFKTRWKNGG